MPPPALVATTGHVAGRVLAQVEGDVLVRSFLIAALLVAPFGWWQWRKVRRQRAERAAALDGGPGDGDTGGAGPGADPAAPRLEEVVARIGALGRDLPPGEVAEVEVPEGVTVDGRVVDRRLAEALLADAVRRGGLDAVTAIPPPGGRFTVRRAERM